MSAEWHGFKQMSAGAAAVVLSPRSSHDAGNQQLSFSSRKRDAHWWMTSSLPNRFNDSFSRHLFIVGLLVPFPRISLRSLFFCQHLASEIEWISIQRIGFRGPRTVVARRHNRLRLFRFTNFLFATRTEEKIWIETRGDQSARTSLIQRDLRWKVSQICAKSLPAPLLLRRQKLARNKQKLQLDWAPRDVTSNQSPNLVAIVDGQIADCLKISSESTRIEDEKQNEKLISSATHVARRGLFVCCLHLHAPKPLSRHSERQINLWVNRLCCYLKFP